jgi:nicotinic acid phosphoribosyltransferase
MLMSIYQQQMLSGGVAITTFALDIRDAGLREMFAKDADGITQTVIYALDALKHRQFDYNVILATVTGKPFEDFYKSDAAKAIFFDPDGKTSRTLISAQVPADAPVYPGTCIYNCKITPDMLAPGQVAIAVFMAPDAKTGENRLHIEATGEWCKDSFLETTMMQAVYQVALQKHLKERGCTFGQWLYEALFRFYLSTTFAGANCPDMTGFLFAGRRTGHFLLLLLQALLAKRIPGSKIAGTSSFDAWYFLTKMGFPNVIPPVGTHAHELQMGAQALFAKFDLSPQNPEFLPISALLSTWFYYWTAHRGGAGPMPMLPDTLGTESFCKGAAAFMVHPMKDGQLDTTQWVSLLSLITSARQDSGKLNAFIEILEKYGCKCSLFASEIDDLKTLLEAYALGYKFFGAGGAMGDSEKVWDVTGEKAFSASMAVKIIRAWLLDPATGSWVRCRYPVKLGDGTDLAKVTADSLLPTEMFKELIAEAERVKRMAKENPRSSYLFYCEFHENRIQIRRSDGQYL